MAPSSGSALRAGATSGSRRRSRCRKDSTSPATAPRMRTPTSATPRSSRRSGWGRLRWRPRRRSRASSVPAASPRRSPARAPCAKSRSARTGTGRLRRSSSAACRSASTCAAWSRPQSRRRSTPASRTAAPASDKSARASRARRSRASRRRFVPSLILNRVERGRYLDSVVLMRLSRRLAALPGIEGAALMIGSPSNKLLLREAGLLATEGEQAGVNDLVIAVRAADDGTGRAALERAFDLTLEKNQAENLLRARTLPAALEALPGANLALISVPGDFAAAEARQALERGLHALVFSSGVPLEDERALKQLALDKGLLLMGPDCGTALIGGAPLAFANVVPRGDVGIVSASGTGLQEVSCLVARLGAGISHGIGVGGRDLDARVGALGTLAAVDALEADLGTRTIVLVSKPPAPSVAERVLERLARCAKRSVVCFLGLEKPGLARTLREAAEMATGRKIQPEAAEAAPRLKGKLVRGLYCGGTLCTEAELVF